MYDKANRLTLVDHQTEQRIRHVYTYDNASRINYSHTLLGNDIITEAKSFTYDDAGQLTEAAGSDTESYIYDENGNRVTANGQDIVTGTGNRLLEDESFYYTYDAEGNLTRRTDKSSGVVTVYTWDHRNRLTKAETITPPPAITFPSSGSFSSYSGQGSSNNGTPAIEDNGQTVHLTDKTWRKIQFSTLGVANSNQYYYALTPNTVLSFDFYSSSLPGIAAIGLDDNNGFNPPDDPIRYFQVAGTDSSSQFIGISPGVSYEGGWQHYEIRLADFPQYAAFQGTEYESYWRWLTFTHTGAGESYFKNIRLYESTPLESVAYNYDAQDRRIQRAHDANGTAAGGVTSQYFVYDGADLSMTFGSAGELTHRYLYGPQVDQVLVDEVFAEGTGGQRVSDDVLWLLADHQGSIRNVVDADGVLRNRIEYDSFGNILEEGVPQPEGGGSSVEAIDQLFYYTGQERDAATGWQLHGQRWYMPETGRYASEDPVAADVNLYRYAHNNPVLYTDPTGLYTQLPTSYLPALNHPSLAYSTGLSSTNFNSYYNSSRYSTPNQASSYFQNQELQRSLTDSFYVAPQFTGPTWAEVERARVRQFAEDVSRVNSLELYAMQPVYDPVMDATAAVLGNTRVQGGLRAATGVGQILGGLAAFEIPVAGPVLTAALGIRGIDNATAGFSQLITGKPTDTKTGAALVDTLTASGVDRQTARNIGGYTEATFDTLTVFAGALPGPRSVPRPPTIPDELIPAPSTYRPLPIIDNEPFYPSFQRLPQDIAVNPTAPDALNLNRRIGQTAIQNVELRRDIATAQRMNARDVRVNQQQVNAAGVRVGANLPDLQFTLPNGQRVYVEYDTPTSPRGLPHLYRLQANDPTGRVLLKTVPSR
jgi:RHS repeat-associated protein